MQPQIDLFEKQDQIQNLERVKSTLMGAVVCFFRGGGEGHYFKMIDLVNYCMEKEKCSPDSPSRVLREARKEGWLDYEVISRSKSQYKILWVK